MWDCLNWTPEQVRKEILKRAQKDMTVSKEAIQSIAVKCPNKIGIPLVIIRKQTKGILSCVLEWKVIM